MLSVAQAAKMLHVSATRVRTLIKKGTLPATKVGNSWCLEEKDVLQRTMNRPKAGRPRSGSDEGAGWDDSGISEADMESLESSVREGHDLYIACKDYFQYRPGMDVIASAKSAEEASFYMAVADFFLQQKQKELVERGVF